MRAAVIVILLATAAVAQAYYRFSYTPMNPPGTVKEVIRDVDVLQMFRLKPALLYGLKEKMRHGPVHLLVIDNDQLSTAKAREIYRRLCSSPNMYAFGVGRKLELYLTINYCARYAHISCGPTKDAADCLVILFVMRIFCLYKDMAKSPRSSISCSIVSRDRVFEQLRSSFEVCGLPVSIESS